MEENNNLYEMGLNETILDSGWKITRVPGGWIYDRNSIRSTSSGVFVPYNEEFKKEENFNMPDYKDTVVSEPRGGKNRM